MKDKIIRKLIFFCGIFFDLEMMKRDSRWDTKKNEHSEWNLN